jgi:Concanavalin A-like lectin/glucanases superfamily/Hint domain
MAQSALPILTPKDNGVAGGGSTPQIPAPIVPVRPVTLPGQQPTAILSPAVNRSGLTPAPVTPTGGSSSSSSPAPLPLLSISAAQTPVKNNGQTDCLVQVNFTYNTNDPNFSYVEIYFKGYHGNKNQQLMATAFSSPATFVCDATLETVVVVGQTVSSVGVPESGFAKTCTLTLSGQVSAPPAPTISQSLVGTPLGYQFGFNQVVLPANDQEVISCYNIYRNTSNSTTGATLQTSIVANPNLTGSITYTDTLNESIGAAYYYFVSAVNTAGYESTLTPAQTGLVLGSIGSIPPSISTPFKIVTTTTSVTLSTSPSSLFTRADGTTVIIGTTSTACTGLPSGNTMFFFPRWNESTQALEFVNASDATIPNITGVTFNGTSHWIETTTDLAVPSNFSVELWFKGTSAGALFSYSNVQGSGTPTQSCIQAQVTSAGEVEFSLYTGTWESVPTNGASVLDGTWHHIMCVYAQSTGVASIFVDGLNTSNGSSFWTDTVGTISGVIGYWHFGLIQGFSGAPVTSNLFVNGMMSHIAVYHTTLTVIQAATHLQAYCNVSAASYDSEVTYDSAVSLWKLIETSGTSAADSIGSNTGTYEGSPTLDQMSPVITILGTPQIAWPFNSAVALALQNLRNWTPLSGTGLQASTPTTGSGTTTSGGGSTPGGSGYTGGSGTTNPSRGGGLCFSGNTRIKTQRGDVRIMDIQVGDLCLTAKGNWLPVRELIIHEAQPVRMHVMPNDELVTFKHGILFNSIWVDAGRIFTSTIDVNILLFTISMDSDEPLDQMLSATTERSFTLSSGVIAHNNTFIK